MERSEPEWRQGPLLNLSLEGRWHVCEVEFGSIWDRSSGMTLTMGCGDEERGWL